MHQDIGPRCRPRVAGRQIASGACFGMLCSALWMTGCTDTLDWREMRPAAWSLQVGMPCKPASHARTLALAGQPVELTLLACSADGHTYAVASADVKSPAQVGPALQALAQAARANVQGTAESDRPAAVPGMTPSAQARHWRLRGRLPDGQAVVEEVLVFSHGTRVFQATVVGRVADEAQVAPFIQALKVLP